MIAYFAALGCFGQTGTWSCGPFLAWGSCHAISHFPPLFDWPGFRCFSARFRFPDALLPGIRNVSFPRKVWKTSEVGKVRGRRCQFTAGRGGRADWRQLRFISFR